jgi:hypothetical protein
MYPPVQQFHNFGNYHVVPDLSASAVRMAPRAGVNVTETPHVACAIESNKQSPVAPFHSAQSLGMSIELKINDRAN